MVVEGWLQRAASNAPRRTAIETPHGSRSYAELLADARSGAAELSERGVAAGSRVAICLPPGLAFAQALHACLLLGAAAVPIDLRLSPAERERLARGAAVCVDAPLGEGLSEAQGPASAAHEPLDPAAGHALDATAVVIHTSGTTAAPRPIELTYGNFLWSALGSAVALGLDPRERWLCALPLSHVGGLSILLRSAIYATTAVVHERFDTERVLHAVSERQITLVSLVPTTLARLLDGGLRRPPDLRCALLGGGPVPPTLLDRARAAGVPVRQTYGLTESASQATTSPLAASPEDQDAAGTPLFCTKVRIAPSPTAHSGEPPVGEILLAGPTVAPGSRARDGWLHTGDLGSIDGAGRLRVSGRESDTIVSGGENIAPAEVEAVLEAHPDVLEAAVIGRPDRRWGEAVTAIVVTRPGGEVAGEALRAHCAASLASFKVPKRIELTREALPRTGSGKLLRKDLV